MVINKLIAFSILLLSSAVYAEHIITQDFIPHHSEYQMQFGYDGRPDKYIQPTLFIYENSPWTYDEVLQQLRRADFLLQQCEVGIQDPRVVFIKTHQAEERSHYFSDKELHAVLAKIPDIESYPRPYILFMDDSMAKSPIGNYSQGFAVTRAGKMPYTKSDLEKLMTLSTIVVAHYDADYNQHYLKMKYYFDLFFNERNNLPDNAFNVLSHELVHSISGLGHEYFEQALMGNTSRNGMYISDLYCNRIRSSLLTQSL